MNIQFKKDMLELCILFLLNRRDYYGYELVEHISQYVNISEGTIYPLLRRFRMVIEENNLKNTSKVKV